MSGNDFTRTLSPLTIRRNWTSGFNDRILAADLDSHDGTRRMTSGTELPRVGEPAWLSNSILDA